MKVTASKAVAVEDSPTGVQAARAAGIRVIAVGHRRADGDWCEGSPFVDGFENLPRVLQALGMS
jgi:beta-phosphoglucomutase-like phosphatase (HAD superfamily)